MGWILFLIFAFIALFLFQQKKAAEKKCHEAETRIRVLEFDREKAEEKASKLAKYEGILDAEERSTEIIAQAENQKDKARSEAAGIIAEAKAKEKELVGKGDYVLEHAKIQAGDIIENAKNEARGIAGEAYEIKEKADEYKAIAKAMENIIKGYGNEYIYPSRTLLDDLAEEYGHSDAAKQLKEIKRQINQAINLSTAAECDYVEPYRKSTAISFVIDAFNGKADSILSKVRKDNYGKLKQQMLDSFSLVNHNGEAFRKARITKEFLSLRLEELRLATVIMELRERDKEEQREIKERMREEEKAQRELEKAIREAQKEEEMLQKAMEKVRGQFEKASEEKKSEYEAKLKELEEKWQEAEERNKRATAMAQLTKSGHVYVISNVGSFGEGVYKIGLTRRLEPLDRVKELGNASVPFSFDVHAMIWSEDAPALENSLHKRFALERMNKVNRHKEFFKTSLSNIREELEQAGIEAKWTIAAEAREYYESEALTRQLEESEDLRKAWLEKSMSLEDILYTNGDEDEDEEESLTA